MLNGHYINIYTPCKVNSVELIDLIDIKLYMSSEAELVHSCIQGRCVYVWCDER